MGMRKAVRYSSRWHDTAIWADYRTWMGSFGVVAPTCSAVRDSTSMAHQFKWVCAAEGFQPAPALLALQLVACFGRRSGDVYSAPLVVPSQIAVAQQDAGAVLAAHVAPVGRAAAATALR